ncbi:hypothetical protein GFC29_2285 [Anoxybacillus sp. B7M1]|jgi:hypothetical protein|uniref:Uncharacterized protein n=1 Tax=Anoxybacteroides rupiense TaxID=311460 RepID=A0ABD5IXS4_9BACL|nr:MULTISPECIES: hypothetical protein [Anoxybacillus]ANB56208.1 hypothetical protein GFC28_3149 [Anoxybacillus sp. B2M1]ANB65133.1 hypothetical protein GFC29_2285 [Anoxybacillus sp. B7M1]KXG09601.1 hypothetical protein AT864_02071 [Anoxybacillus sp. P3H1B]MBB3908948.1 hypothetical protein [Anoxybacillus rupiensis]MBS2772267.1 hypothetical protein [Anoxybacillus rupiensis]
MIRANPYETRWFFGGPFLGGLLGGLVGSALIPPLFYGYPRPYGPFPPYGPYPYGGYWY